MFGREFESLRLHGFRPKAASYLAGGFFCVRLANSSSLEIWRADTKKETLKGFAFGIPTLERIDHEIISPAPQMSKKVPLYAGLFLSVYESWLSFGNEENKKQMPRIDFYFLTLRIEDV